MELFKQEMKLFRQEMELFEFSFNIIIFQLILDYFGFISQLLLSSELDLELGPTLPFLVFKVEVKFRLLTLDLNLSTQRVIMQKSAQSVEKWLRCRLFSVQRFCSAAWNTAVLQDHCFDSRLDPFHLGSHHSKFQLNQLRNG